MKAVTYDRYGPPEVLSLSEVPRPVPGEHDLLIRVHAAGVDAGVVHLLRGDPYLVRLAFGLRRPKNRVLGLDVAGTVEAVGPKVTRFRPGDEVYAEAQKGGSYAEFVCVAEKLVAHKPANLTFAQAAAVPVSANTALEGLRDIGKVKPGQTVLINGAGGGVGTFAVQVAKLLGAQVIGVCSTSKLDLVRSLGADEVIDYTKHDFTAAGRTYDLVFDLGGRHSLKALRRALTPEGTLVLCAGHGGPWLGPIGMLIHANAVAPFARQRLRTFVARSNGANLATLREYLEAGQLVPAVDKVYPLAQAADAIAHFETGRARGKLVLAV